MKKALYILAEFSDRDFDWLLSAGRKKPASAGAVLIHEGEPTDALYIVLQGRLGVTVEALGGEEIAQLSEGEVVGEMSFVDSRLPSATVRAIEASQVWVIPRSQLSTKLRQDIEFASHFYHAVALFLSDRLRDTVNRFGAARASSLGESEMPEDLSPEVARNLELAQARLSWLLSRLKDTP